MWSRFFVHLTAAVCLRTAAVMDRAPSLTAAGFTSTDHHVRRFLLHQAWLPIQNTNSRMCQLKLPFSLLLSSQRCVLPQRETWFIHLFTFQGNTWNQSERIKKTSWTSEIERHDSIPLLYCMKKHCLYLLRTFISFAGSKCSVILSFPAHQTTQTSDQTFNRLIKSAFEVSCTVLMSSC